MSDQITPGERRTLTGDVVTVRPSSLDEGRLLVTIAVDDPGQRRENRPTPPRHENRPTDYLEGND